MIRGIATGPFALAAVITACVGATVGAERSALPLAVDLGGAATWGAAAFVAAFGISKALANLIAGPSAARLGRRRTLLLGWLIAVPVPFALAFSPESWPIVAANVLLGVSQGLCWTTALVMQVDIAGPRRRGLAAGVNEFAGYAAVGLAAYGAALAAGLLDARRGPALIAACAIALGIALSLAARETAHTRASAAGPRPLRPRQAGRAVIHQAGFVNNANDAVAWAFLPLLLVARGADLAQVGVATAAYPASWGLTQLVAGPLSDRIGRRTLVAGGMLLQALAIAGLAAGGGALLLALAWGVGTGMVYPSLVAAAADAAPGGDTARGIATYRFWRDAGVAGGALGGLAVAGLAGLETMLLAVAAITAASGLVAMRLPARGPADPLDVLPASSIRSAART